eukprot:m.29613 g.29613  ORF g.29613 m.29613 type:complete len:52 (-) comp13758_c0_seq1:75-230(-)
METHLYTDRASGKPCEKTVCRNDFKEARRQHGKHDLLTENVRARTDSTSYS